MKTMNKVPCAFLPKLKDLSINACKFLDDPDENIYVRINQFVAKMDSLVNLSIIGMQIGEHLGDLVGACKRPNIKSLDLKLNGIEADYCIYFGFILNFNTIEELNLSQNWILLNGLERMTECFGQLKHLKKLSVGSNKLFSDDNRRTEILKDILVLISPTLQVLELPWNSMKNDDLDLLSPIISKMP